MSREPSTDIGVNLLHKQFDPDREDVIDKAHAAGIARMLITCTDLAETARGIEFCGDRNAGDGFWCTAGVHPHHAKDTQPDWLSRLGNLALNPAVKALGEMGLDFNRNFSPPERQIEVFRAQLELATRIAKPAFVHDRDSHGMVFEMLSEHADQLTGVVVHCFTGTREDLTRYLEAGFHIGITGWVCDRRRGQPLRDLIPDIPLDHLLVETDAPYLRPHISPEKAPEPHQRRNEPALLNHVINEIALLQQRDPDEVARATNSNASALFDLPESS